MFRSTQLILVISLGGKSACIRIILINRTHTKSIEVPSLGGLIFASLNGIPNSVIVALEINFQAPPCISHNTIDFTTHIFESFIFSFYISQYDHAGGDC